MGPVQIHLAHRGPQGPLQRHGAQFLQGSSRRLNLILCLRENKRKAWGRNDLNYSAIKLTNNRIPSSVVGLLSLKMDVLQVNIFFHSNDFTSSSLWNIKGLRCFGTLFVRTEIGTEVVFHRLFKRQKCASFPTRHGKEKVIYFSSSIVVEKYVMFNRCLVSKGWLDSKLSVKYRLPTVSKFVEIFTSFLFAEFFWSLFHFYDNLMTFDLASPSH